MVSLFRVLLAPLHAANRVLAVASFIKMQSLATAIRACATVAMFGWPEEPRVTAVVQGVHAGMYAWSRMKVADLERLNRAAVAALFGKPHDLHAFQKWMIATQEEGIDKAALAFADQGARAEESLLQVYPRAPLDEEEASALRPKSVTAELWAKTRCSAEKAQHTCARFQLHSGDHVAVDTSGELIVARWSQDDPEGSPAPTESADVKPPSDVGESLDDDENEVAEDPLGLGADPNLAHAFGE